jgi:hypothetical protein
MPWKPEVLVAGTWNKNGLVFATEKEALDSAFDLMMRWFAVQDHRAVEVDEPVNYDYTQRKLVSVAGAFPGPSPVQETMLKHLDETVLDETADRVLWKPGRDADDDE